ncbi:MAG: 2OG-Fe(II) oxygenase [Alphaproteobacteria bacterium]|nr:2OG-Fe(II) oxygenase [Alphaproteobacteria bacterium]
MSAFEDIAALLEAIDGPGNFMTSGTVETTLPVVRLSGFGALPLPFSEPVRQLVLPHASAAPYGRGPDTLLDPDVRRCHQIDASHVELDPHLMERVRDIARAAAEGLGLEGPVDANLYKLLLYGAGDFFVPHRDTEKEPGMFATLIVALPGDFTGGELRIEHEGVEREVQLHAPPHELAWVAFYADCRHEVRPLTSGARAVLVFNLVRQHAPTAPLSLQPVVQALREPLARWAAGVGPDKLVFLLDHRYTPAELAWNRLKGRDQSTARALREAPPQDWHVYLALISLTEAWDAEEVAYRSRRHAWRGDYDDLQLYDQLEDVRVVASWVDRSGTPVERTAMGFSDEELIPEDGLHDAEPDVVSYHEATGNEGATLERTYRRAAVVLWPPSREASVVASGGLPGIVDALENTADPAFAAQLALAGLPDFSAPERHRRDADLAVEVRYLDALVRFELRWALLEALSRSVRSPATLVPPIARALAALPLGDAIACMLAVIDANDLEQAMDSAALVIASSDDRVSGPGALRLLEVLETPAGWWSFDAPKLATLICACGRVASGPAQLWQLTRRFPRRFAERDVLMATELLVEGGVCPDRWLRRVARHLAALPSEAPGPPSDHSRPGPTCACPDCVAVARFMADPELATFTWPTSEANRKHVIRECAGLDVQFSVIKSGSPHKLHCQKTSASFEKRRRLWHLQCRVRSLASGAVSAPG